MKLFLLLPFILIFQAFAGPTIVGNGDDGSDLENYKPLQSKKILSAHAEALTILKRLNVQGISHLGSLIPELENTKMYMVESNISAERMQELGAFHSGSNKLIYARTIARPYATTRFFPAAEKLDSNQLIALHIHEALHRSLPEAFREDEKVVSEITLAIVSPLASHDQVKEVTRKKIDDYTGQYKGNFKDHTSFVTLSYKGIVGVQKTGTFSPQTRSYQLSNRIYPFDNNWSLLGLGVDLDYAKNERRTTLGTLGLFLSIDLFTLRGFDISFFSKWNRALSDTQDFTNYMISRDSFHTGVTFKKKRGSLLSENLISYTWQRKDKRTLNAQSYEFDLGSITNLKSQLLYQRNNKYFGGFIDLHLIGATDVKVEAKTSRSSVLALGPVFEHHFDELSYQIYYHYVVDSLSKGSTVSINDQLIGVQSRNHLGLSLKYKF
ncbi:MAG: hypothetical protein COW01_01440 [Bdellovibrionales bacterium CG12_big_fil_rev_8_21_14_0_65_38_15]|nr:MAG: hypothetical protein COW79_03165 [Bdellovibrionales bacterium CG22_combo_CG10-13_8_21_14_all_38_13]PIQ57239.1 MAG: hypothetical protein COW01_01440 [Bdellovibrionales bacterium CG12_big_fil_rev_8_21_14_0_65_38_15]PIR31471.1 MAG: hypothetical protein COV38_00375 [Bdellovibrionales bacterium CG11_big_fil_rev_8_21_14_0_20_38_13]